MKDIDTITNIMNQLFPKETVVETLLLKGGMSNSTYVVFTKNNKYTIRIPNAYSHLFTNWKREKTIYDSLSLSPLIPKLYYYSVESGIKVSQYVESVKPIEEVSYDEILSFLEEVQVQLIPKCNYESCFYRLDLFESYIDKNNIAGMNFKDYEIYKKHLVDHQGFIAPRQIVFCHGDFQPSNLIYTNEGFKMLDLEFSGIEDEIYDIACFGNWNDDLGLNLLKEYSIVNYSNDLIKYYYWRLYLSLQWFNVAIFKEQHGLSSEFGFSFQDVAIGFLKKAKTYIDILRSRE